VECKDEDSKLYNVLVSWNVNVHTPGDTLFTASYAIVQRLGTIRSFTWCCIEEMGRFRGVQDERTEAIFEIGTSVSEYGWLRLSRKGERLVLSVHCRIAERRNSSHFHFAPPHTF
jgi:hypothetical protein